MGSESYAHTSNAFKFSVSSHFHSLDNIPKITHIVWCYIIPFYDTIRQTFKTLFSYLTLFSHKTLYKNRKMYFNVSNSFKTAF